MWRSLWAALTAVLITQSLAAEVPGGTERSTVYWIQNPECLADNRPQGAAVSAMVHQIVQAATGQDTPKKAWTSLVSPKDRVGIKVSTIGGPGFSTHTEVVDAIVDGLRMAGVPLDQILVWDRNADTLSAAGYQQRRGGYQVRSIPPATGYDPAAAIDTSVIGKLIWGDLLFPKSLTRRLPSGTAQTDPLSQTSHVSRVLSQEVTKVINVPVLSDSAGCAIAGAIYNLAIPNVDNWRRFVHPDGSGAASLAELAAEKAIRSKVVLHLMDALVAQYAGGPSASPNYAYAHSSLYAAFDPLALDLTALHQLDLWRTSAKLPPLAPKARWMLFAEDLGVGIAHPNRIDLVAIPLKKPHHASTSLP